MRALLIDDDHELARLLRDYMASHGVAIDHVDDGAKGLERLDGLAAQAAREAYDIVLLDVMLPGIDGLEVCRRVRAKHEVPIVMLTARGEDTDRVVGLEIGADDYVPKPFNPRELLARMRAVVRRTHPAPAVAAAAAGVTEAKEGASLLHVGDLTVDVPALRATLGERELQLTSFEFRVLVVLARRAGEAVTREELAGAVLPKGGKSELTGKYDPSVDRSLDVHVSHLRQKMGDGREGEPRRIRTVRGVGYVLVKPS